MAVELHLPDLPEVELRLSPLAAGEASARPGVVAGVGARTRLSWPARLVETLSTYLPLVLMLLLAVGTAWLVQRTPVPSAARAARAPLSTPDYSMHNVILERFAANGRLRLRLQGDELHHYPDSDRVEVKNARIEAFDVAGRVTIATAQQVLGNGDASELQLTGGAQVQGRDAQGSALVIRSDFLHLFLVTEQVRTHKPVRVTLGNTELQAGGLEYDHPAQKLELKGPIRATLAPLARTPKAAR